MIYQILSNVISYNVLTRPDLLMTPILVIMA